MISDYASLIGTGIITFAFVICGLLDILSNPVIKILLISGFIFLIINMILVKSKKDQDEEQKNLP